jgi:hypothetical protein
VLAAVPILLLVAHTAAATMMPGPPQELVRRARDIAEVVALTEYNAYEVTRVWKGSLPTTLVLPAKSGSVQFVPGRKYVVLLRAERPPQVLAGASAASILQYLSAPRRVTPGDLVRMLRGWHHGTVSDASMLRWLGDTLPVADVDDWTVLDGEEMSLVLTVMEDLKFRMVRYGAPLEELTCQHRVLRERIAPMYIDVLLDPPLTDEEADAGDARFPDFHDLENRLCAP